MGLKLKDSDEGKKKENRLDSGTNYGHGLDDINQEEIDAFEGRYVNSPVRITATAPQADISNKQKSFDVIGLIKWIVLIALVVVGIKFIVNVVNPKVTDITGYVDYDATELAAELGVELEENSSMNKRITHYCDGVVSVDGDGEIGVVYIDGVRKGMHMDDKKYSMFGIKIGDWQVDVDEILEYDYEGSFEVLNDLYEGNSTACFYYNVSKNDCLVVICNDKSARVVAVTYFNDYRLISGNLSGID